MPLPKPRPEEKRQEYINRFMESKAAKKEFDTRKQRLAVAYEKWKNKKSK